MNSSRLRWPRFIFAGSMVGHLSGCSTIGDDFEWANAPRVQNGMTREQVMAIMGSSPSTVEGADPGKLIWLYSTADPLSVKLNRVSFSFDAYGRVYGIPAAGLTGGAAAGSAPCPPALSRERAGAGMSLDAAR